MASMASAAAAASQSTVLNRPALGGSGAASAFSQTMSTGQRVSQGNGGDTKIAEFLAGLPGRQRSGRDPRVPVLARARVTLLPVREEPVPPAALRQPAAAASNTPSPDLPKENIAPPQAASANGQAAVSKKHVPVLVGKRAPNSQSAAGAATHFNAKTPEVGKSKTAEVVRPKYDVSRLLNAGGWGKVHVATQTIFKGAQKTTREVALKSNLLRADLEKKFSALPDGERELRIRAAAKERLAALKVEAENHKQLQGVKNVAELLDHFDDTDAARSEPKYVLVFPLLKNDLARYCLSRKLCGTLPFDSFVNLARNGLDTLRGLKERRLVHRDIKPANLFHAVGKEQTRFIDWGGMLPIGKTDFDFSQTTTGYVAPELWLGAPSNHLLDVWSFGVTLYEVFTSRRLFSAHGSCDPNVYLLRIIEQLGLPSSELIKASKRGNYFFALDANKNFAWDPENATERSQINLIVDQWVKDVEAEAASRGLSPEVTQSLVSFLKGMLAYKRQEPEALYQHPFLKPAAATAATAAAT